MSATQPRVRARSSWATTSWRSNYRSRVRRCDLLALVGNQWLTITGADRSAAPLITPMTSLAGHRGRPDAQRARHPDPCNGARMPFAGELPPSPGGLVCARLLNSAPGLTRRRSHEASGKSHGSPTRTDHRAVSSPVPGLRSLVRLSTRGASSLRVQLAATARLLGGRTASASAYGRRCTSPAWVLLAAC